jgi:hypothetical protein
MQENGKKKILKKSTITLLNINIDCCRKEIPEKRGK